MKNRCGRVLAALLCFAIFTGLFSTVSFADRGNYGDGNVQTEGDFRYQVIEASQLGEWDASLGLTGDRFARLVGYTGMTGNLTIPSTLGGCPVVWIGGGAFKGNNAIQTVTVGANVRYIGKNAFENCGGLQRVLMANSVREIGAWAFNSCAALKTVTIQKNSRLTAIADGAFYNCGALIDFVIPAGVTRVGEVAFCHCDSLTELVFPDSVTALGAAVCFSCANLQKVVIGDGIRSIFNRDDYNGANWGVSNVCDGAFEGCVNLTSLTLGKSVESIEAECFAGTGVVSLVFPDSMRTIGDYAFYKCPNLQSVDLGDGTVTIGRDSFYSDASLKRVRIGRRLQTIGNYAFENCTALESIIIPSNVTSLGGGAFVNCAGLKSAVIGNGITELRSIHVSGGNESGADGWEDGIFERCTSLARVTIGSAVKSIGIDTFAETGLTEIEIPDNVTAIGNGAFYKCRALKKAHIGDGVITVGYSCFAYDAALTDLHIGSGVVSIGDSAFVECDALRYAFIPSNVTTLGISAFYGCDNLETAVVGNGVTSLGTRSERIIAYSSNYRYFGSFDNCPRLKKITLGSGLTFIDRFTFRGTAIDSLTVPFKVSSLGVSAFGGVGNLNDVYFAGDYPNSVGSGLFSESGGSRTIRKIAGKAGFDDGARTFVPVVVDFKNSNDDVFTSPTDDQIMSSAGDYVIEPIAPVALGYVFGGWYADRACTKPWDFKNTFVTKNTTLYAKWTPSDELVPARPANVSVSENDGGRIALRWSEVDGAQAYNVYCNGVKANAAPITETAFTVAGIRYASTYELTVSAVNAKGESEKSLIAAVNTPDDPRGEFGGHYYLAVDAPLSLADAQAYAQERGGHLASVTTPEEQAFVSSLLDGKAAGARCRIGFARVDGAFAWVTGEQTDYVNWAEGQPGDGQSAALLRDGGAWVALEADAAAETGFLIEWDEAYPAPADGAPVIPAEPPALELPDVQEPAGSGTRGDADGDGRVTARDARLALRASARLETLEPAAFACVDLNGDGKITAAEARKILRYSAKLETSI